MTDPFTLGPALLFCPADRPERYQKALDRADIALMIIDGCEGVAEQDLTIAGYAAERGRAVGFMPAALSHVCAQSGLNRRAFRPM